MWRNCFARNNVIKNWCTAVKLTFLQAFSRHVAHKAVPVYLQLSLKPYRREAQYVAIGIIENGPFLSRHVLKPETTIRNHRNEKTKTSETTETKPTKQSKRNKITETNKTHYHY